MQALIKKAKIDKFSYKEESKLQEIVLAAYGISVTLDYQNL